MVEIPTESRRDANDFTEWSVYTIFNKRYFSSRFCRECRQNTDDLCSVGKYQRISDDFENYNSRLIVVKISSPDGTFSVGNNRDFLY